MNKDSVIKKTSVMTDDYNLLIDNISTLWANYEKTLFRFLKMWNSVSHIDV